MSVWENQLTYLYERAQEHEGHEESGAYRHLTITDNGSVYTAVVPPEGFHIHLHALSVYNPGATTALIRVYVAGDTGPSNIALILSVPAAVDSRVDAFNFGVKIPAGKALTIGSLGAQAASLPEAILYYHLEND